MARSPRSRWSTPTFFGCGTDLLYGGPGALYCPRQISFALDVTQLPTN
jgi:hypothetical protein